MWCGVVTQPRRRRTREVARGDEGEEREIESAVVGESALFCINLVLGVFVFGDTIHVHTVLPPKLLSLFHPNHLKHSQGRRYT